MISYSADIYRHLSSLPNKFRRELQPNITVKVQLNSQIEDKSHKKPTETHVRPEQQDICNMSSHILVVIYRDIRVLEGNNVKK